MYRKFYYFAFIVGCLFVIVLFVYSFGRIMKNRKKVENLGIPTSEERYEFDPCCPCSKHGEEAVMIKDGSYFCEKCIY